VLQQLALRFGRRGLKLITLGFVFAGFGFNIVTTPRTDRFSRPGVSPLDWADSRAWGLFFLVGGLTALCVGVRRRQAPDAIGFAALVAPALVWTLLYTLSFTVNFATGGEYGQPGRWVAALIWGAIATSIRIDAGWDDPTDPIARPA
jgi:hypothetical protein